MELIPNQIRLRRYRTGNTVGDQLCFPVVSFLEVILNRFTKHNDFIRITDRILLALTDEFGAETGLPFFPVPVQTVDGADYLFAHPLRNKAEKSRAFCVDMHHIIVTKSAAKRRKKRCSHRCQAFLFNGRHRLHVDTLVCAAGCGIKFGTAYMMSPAVIAGHPVALLNHTCTQLLHNDLNTSLPGRHPLVTKHGNIQISSHNILLNQTPTACHRLTYFTQILSVSERPPPFAAGS